MVVSVVCKYTGRTSCGQSADNERTPLRKNSPKSFSLDLRRQYLALLFEPGGFHGGSVFFNHCLVEAKDAVAGDASRRSDELS